MAEGIIKKWFPDREFGFISPVGGGQDAWFNLTRVKREFQDQIREGIKVSFEMKKGERGPKASNICLLPGEQLPEKEIQSGRKQYLFFNPYNFVRCLTRERPDNQVLGNCPPPPHDRYVGLNGRVTCTVESVSPLFISDSHQILDEDGHRTRIYRFFTYEGKPALPASSLRGMLRSVYEAATNSCFAVFNGEDYLSYHLPAEDASKLVPGRILYEMPGKWEIELLTGTTPLVTGRRPQGPQYAAWAHFYRPLKSSRTKASVPDASYSMRQKLSIDGWQHKDCCWALIELIEHPKRRFKFWNVVALDENQEALKPSDNQRLVQGYLCINNQSIENKHDERLFFCTSENTTKLDLSEKVRKTYNVLLDDYYKRHQDEVRDRENPSVPENSKPSFSRFIVDKEKLQNGDLVYVMLKYDDNNQPVVDFLVPVSVPRTGYRHNIDTLLPEEHLKACRKYESLCPACRVFGWVYKISKEDEEISKNKVTAYAGRVRLENAMLISNARGKEEGITLPVLSTPKPTTTRFYLSDYNGLPVQGEDDFRSGYDGKDEEGRLNRLRGRKFYRHHGSGDAKYYFDGNQPGRQNRTVRNIQKPGSRFEFKMEFENLTEVELGALLWALELEEGMFHRLGLGKPLGFGSVKLRVTGLEIMRPGRRYVSLADSGWEPVLDHKDHLIRNFKQEISKIYGQPFDELPNIKDLKAILSAPVLDLPVHYPTPQPGMEGRNYEWFMGNKRGGREAGPRLALALATEDKGLPLIDKDGNIIK